MLSHANLIERRPRPSSPPRTSAPTTSMLCYLPMAWIGNSLFSLVLQPAGRLHLQLPGEARDGAARPARARADARAGAAAHMGEHADRRCRCAAADASPLKRKLFEHFRGVAERAELLRGRRQAGAEPAAAAAGARRGRRLRAGARPARAAPRALGLYRRRAARPRHVPLLSLVRGQPEAGLRRDRAVPAWPRCSPTARSIPNTVGRVFPGIEVRIDRRRRGAGPLGRRVQGLLQAARGDPRRR